MNIITHPGKRALRRNYQAILAERRRTKDYLSGGGGPAYVERFVATITLTAGGSPVQQELPRDFWYAGLLLRLSGTLTVAGGASDGTLADENPMTVLNRIRVEGTGGGQSTILKDLKGPHVYRRSHVYDAIEPGATPITAASVQAATAFSAQLPVWFILRSPNAPTEVQMMTALNPQEFSRLMLEITPGTTGDFINGGDRTVTIPSLSVDVYALQIANPIGGIGTWRYLELWIGRENPTTAVTDRQFSTQFPTGRVYRDIMYRTTNEVTNTRRPVDDLITASRLLIGLTQVQRYRAVEEFIERTRRELRIPNATNPSGLNALSTRTNPIVGYYFQDFLKEGRLEGLLDTTRFPTLGIQLDPRIDTQANNRFIEIVVGQLIPGPRAARVNAGRARQKVPAGA